MGGRSVRVNGQRRDVTASDNGRLDVAILNGENTTVVGA